MKILKGLLFFFFMTIMGSMNAQDIHFTQFYLSPLTTNPAYTGAFEGTFRIGGIYRDQWGGVISSPYRTPSFYVDAPILMVGKRSWLGVGGMMYADKAGQLDLSTNQFMGSAAIHLALDPKMKSIFTFGIQAGYTNRSVDIANATFGNEIQNGQIPGGDESVFSSNYFDMNVGALLKSQLNDQMRIEIGLAADNLLTADYHLNDSSIDADSTAGSASVDGRDAWENPSLFLLHGQFFIDLTDKIQAKPAFLFQSKSGANEIMIQAIGGYHLNEEKDMTLNVGLGYRLRDATKFIVGMDYKQFRVGAAYDLTVSDLRDADGVPGGFELGASYIAKIYKKPDVKPVIFCPRF